jgi:hypothetical protein
MATYTELRSLYSNDELKNKIDMAVVIAANNLLSGAPTEAEQKWAVSVFGNPRAESVKALMAVLATNAAASLSVITGASDADIQAAVDTVVPALVVAN